MGQGSVVDDRRGTPFELSGSELAALCRSRPSRHAVSEETHSESLFLGLLAKCVSRPKLQVMVNELFDAELARMTMRSACVPIPAHRDYLKERAEL